MELPVKILKAKEKSTEKHGDNILIGFDILPKFFCCHIWNRTGLLLTKKLPNHLRLIISQDYEISGKCQKCTEL